MLKHLSITWLFIAGVAVLALAGVPRSARADGGGNANLIHACVKQQHVRIVGPNDVCRRNETSTHWSITGPQGPQGEPGTPADTTITDSLQTQIDDLQSQVDALGGGAGSFIVFDSTGKRVGRVLSVVLSGQVPLVAFKVDGFSFALRVVPDGFQGNAADPFFVSTNCSGTPHIIDVPISMPLVVVGAPDVGVQGMMVYVPDPTSSSQTLTIESRLVQSAVGGPGVCLPESSSRVVFPAIKLIDLGDLFTPTFEVVADAPSLP